MTFTSLTRSIESIASMTADVYRAGTFRAKKRRTKEINFPVRPPRYKMDGSGRDGFVFLHDDVGQAPKLVFRPNSTPWGQNPSTCPYAFDPNLRHAATVPEPAQEDPKQCQHLHWLQGRCKNPYRRGRQNNLRPSARSKKNARRARRQAEKMKRLSTPIPRLVVNKKSSTTGKTRRPGTADHKKSTPWVGNSKRPTRPFTSRPHTSSGFRCRKTNLMSNKLFADIDKSLLG